MLKTHTLVLAPKLGYFKKYSFTQYTVMTYMQKDSRVDICICITDSLCCTLETNTTL